MGIFSKNGIIKSDGAARLIRQSGLEERANEANSRELRVSKADFTPVNDLPPDRRFFAPQPLQTAYVRLKTRLSEVGARFDPEMYVAGLTIAVAYVRNESSIFSDFARFMQNCFGESIKPHLLSFYASISNAPDIQGRTLTSHEQCKEEYALIMRPD